MFENLPLKLLSVLLASLVWLFVMGEEHSERSYTVPVQISRLADGLVLLNEEDYVVEVRVSGPRGILNSLSDDGFAATLDLAPYGKGEVDVPIAKDVIQAPKGVTIARIRPAAIRVHLDSMVEKEIPLKAVVHGDPVAGYEVATVELEPPSLRLTGPESLLAQITEIPTTPIDVTGLTGDATLPVKVDFQRHHVSWPPRPLFAQVKVSPRMVTRSLPVVAEVTGMVRDGYEITKVEVTPESVSVRGPQRVVEGLAKVSAGKVEVAGRHRSLSRKRTLAPPADGVTFPEGDGVAVQVEIAERLEERVVEVHANLRGEVGRDYKIGAVRIVPDRVRLRGPFHSLAEMKQVETVEVEIDGARRLITAHPHLRLPAGVRRVDDGPPLSVIVPVEERIISRTAKVKPAFEGEPPADLQVTELTVRPPEVEVTGPAHRLRFLDSVATRTLAYPKAPGSYPMPAVALALPEEVSKASPAQVEVLLTLALPTVRRRLPVHPTLEGALPAGVRLAEVVVKPGQVEVAGPEGKLEAITKLATEPISLSQVRATQSLTVHVVAPVGMEVATPEVAVTLTIESVN